MKILAASLVAFGLVAGAVPAAHAAGVAVRVGDVGIGIGHPHGRYHYRNHWYQHRSWRHHGWHYW